MKIPQSVREQIEKGPLAHLTTLNRDGSPQVTLIWVGIEDDEFVIGHLALHQKIKNIRRDPRVALSLIVTDQSAGTAGIPGRLRQRADYRRRRGAADTAPGAALPRAEG